MRLINRQYIPGYGDLRVISNKAEVVVVTAVGHRIGVYNAIGKFLFLYMGEYVLIPYDFSRDRG